MYKNSKNSITYIYIRRETYTDIMPAVQSMYNVFQSSALKIGVATLPHTQCRKNYILLSS